MIKDDMKLLILQAKDKSELTWEALGAAIRMSPVWTASACLGMNSMAMDKAHILCELLQLPDEVAKALAKCPHKSRDKTVPTDPLIYRLYEMVNVYGDSIKEIIHEKFGDGIMSAIDFTMDITKEENPKGDRVVMTRICNFLMIKAWLRRARTFGCYRCPARYGIANRARSLC